MDAPAQTTAVFTAEKVSTIPWWGMLAIIFLPGLLAIVFTMASIIIWRRLNRADGKPPIKKSKIVLWTIVAGCFYGPVFQFCLQRLVNFMTGAPTYPELYLLAFLITGVASILCYELLRWWTREHKPSLHVLLSVRHMPGVHNTGKGEPDLDDMTVFRQHEETVPKHEINDS